jgi:hypothetical protein
MAPLFCDPQEMEFTMLLRAIERVVYSGVVATALMLPLPRPADAATPYDGTWVLDVPSSTIIPRTSESACPALRLPVQVTNGQVIAMLHRVPSEDADDVESGAGTGASPITGSVNADGFVVAQWQGYHATGQLTGNTGEITVDGECGPRAAEATRVAQ